MFKRKNVDILGGPIFKSIVLYAIPVIVASLIQNLFSAADLMIVGQMASEEVKDAVTASISATGHIVSLLVNSFVGLSAGVSVVVARILGQGEDARVKKAASTALISALAIGSLAMVICIVFSGKFLLITECPDDCLDMARIYLDIYAVGIPFILFYNFGAAIIRATGDTQRPLYYILISGTLNVLLNVIFCFILEEKVAAVAIATTASQITSAACVFVHLLRMNGPCKLDLKGLSFSFAELLKMLRIGLPTAINNALFSISNLQIQAEVNLYGKVVGTGCVAGAGVSSNLEHFCVALSGGFNAAVVPFVGQNVGAGKPERVKKTILTCFILSGASNFSMALIIYTFRDFFLGLYLPQGGIAVEFAAVKMIWVLLPFFIAGLYGTLSASLQAFGYSFAPMINSIACVLGLRVVWMTAIYPALLGEAERSLQTANYLFMCYPISWLLCLVANAIAFFIVYARYKKGKIAKI